MPTDAKRATVAELRGDLSRSTTLVTTEYRGLTVKDLGEIRRALRKQNVTYRVVKNRLMRIAAEQEGNPGIALLLRGPSAIAFGTGDEALVAKTVLEALRPYKLVKVTGGVVGGKIIAAGVGIGVMRIERALPGQRLREIGAFAGRLMQRQRGADHGGEIGGQAGKQQLARAPGMPKPIALGHCPRDESEGALGHGEP